MLNINTLQQMIQDPLEKYLNRGIVCAMKGSFPVPSAEGDEMAQKFADTLTDTCAEPLAQALAGAIDYYVRSISISGTIITNGSPSTHTATISSPAAATNGKVPNSLGIS